MVKKGDKFQTYSDELKIQVIKSYLNGEGSQTAYVILHIKMY
ncbi:MULTISPECIES: hypothetical protein [Bacillus]|nr:hypothetical protein [Bacillus pseudomycoides]AIK37034.1 hypothetical protein DJ92_3472 [Bacillus pseudomycoides]AJI20046.1 hypothetical protein BG07_1472 [Bacillus pseudomycoides]MEB3055031.1 hypothetical protein [Bacillus pseudomycoides]MED4712653.1 hypothetical protein [Bacillus pseudomycoides]